MATTTVTQNQVSTNGRGGRRRGGSANRGGRGGQRGGGAAPADHGPAIAHGNAVAGVAPGAVSEAAARLAASAAASAQKAAAEAGDTDGIDTCWICAEPVKYWSVSECNHRTCHVCALRLRALYKKMECTFCKASSP
jgi:hypothetical protein